jgi:dTDP-4-amino-4,6-dideoxygalactose transaminase
MTNNQFSPWPSFTQEESDVVQAILLSNKVNYWTGAECQKFESEFADFCGVKHAVTLMNGTTALDVALKAIKIEAGDEVVVTSRTFFASVSSIVNLGATPVFADVSIDTQNISFDSICEKITHKTKAILCVHLSGWPCEMDEIMSLAEDFGLHVIEDCAQAHGAKYKGKPVGSIGHIGCWSFCQDKIISTCGEGGMVTTNDEAFWRRMWAYKDHGKSYEKVYERGHTAGFRWLHDSFGANYRMTEMQAAVGRIQLNKMNDWHAKRLCNANKIWNTARKCRGLRVPDVPEHVEHAAYKCYVFVNPDQLKEDWNRDLIIKEINALGVPCYPGSCSEVYLEKAFDNTGFSPKERLPNAKELGVTSLMFLVHPTLTESEIQQTCDAITSIMELGAK